MPRPLAIEILDAIVTSYRAHRSHVEDDGPSIDRDFEVGDFEQLDVAGPMDVEVRTGAAASVQASGPEWALENLRVEQQDDRLLIGCEGDINSDVTVVVTVPRLAAARLSGSGDVSIDSIKGDAFECSSSGSGDLSVDEIDVQTLKLSTSGSGDIDIDKIRAADVETTQMGSGDLSFDAVESAAFKLSMNGSGDAHIDEYCGDTIEAALSGSGDLEFDMIEAKTVKLSLFGSGDAYVDQGAAELRLA